MANTSQETILAAFQQAAGASGDRPGAADQGLIDALGQASQAIASQNAATAANTDALAQDSEAHQSSASKDVTSMLSAAGDVLGGGLSLMPLVSLFSGLFGGGGSDSSAPLTRFSLPNALNLQATDNDESVAWGENGLPHSAGNSGSNGTQQITVQVQAMDSQSFLDHSDDIAQAVRRAMLNMNSINDVFTNL